MTNRRALFALGSVVAAGVAGATWKLLRKPIPRTDDRLQVEGLESPVEILTDRRGIPHIYARGEYDLFWTQGFTMARERLFQMDFLRRFGAGRLSEIAGEPTIEIDRWQRVFGLRRNAEKKWRHCGEESRAALHAFAAGVNGAMQEMERTGTRPIEFSLLGYRPERWLPVDSLAILNLLSLSLSVGWESDLLREGVRRLLGDEEAERYLSLPPDASPLIASPGLRAMKDLASGVGGGSNCWVVAGARSESGMPLLANDPHLSLRLPALWFAQHLDAPTLKVAGLALPGVPGIVLGHNEESAWGLTAAFVDVQDLYVEERVEESAEGPIFRWGNERLPATVLEERILVKGRDAPVAQRITITRHGPLISDLLPDEERDLALRWTVEEPDDTVAAILGVNRATSWTAAREAFANLGGPPMNVSWAGRDGTIGWMMAGRLPIRQGERGVAPVDGGSGANEWIGYLSLDELPQRVNPEAGYLVHANNRSGEDEDPWLGIDFFPGYRAARIVDLITARAVHNVDSFRAICTDTYSHPEYRLARLVADLPVLSGELGPVQAHLAAWDGRMAPDSPGALIAHHLFHQVRHTLVSRQLASLVATWEGRAVQPDLQPVLPHAYNAWAWVLERLEDRDHPWWSTDGTSRREGRDEILILALQACVQTLRARWGDDPSRWRWGRFHQRLFEHPLSVLPVIGRFFSRGPYPLPGGPFSPCADLSTVQHYQSLSPVGASARLIADLSDWDQYQLSLAGGNSGHPASPHYADQLKGWLAGETAPLPWRRETVERSAKGQLILQPAAPAST